MADPVYQPPLTRWPILWRLLACLGTSALVWGSSFAYFQWTEQRWLFWTDLALGAASFVAVHWRRRLPLTIALVINAVSALSITAIGPALLSAVSLATRRRWSEIIPLAVVGMVAGLVSPHLNQGSAGPEPWWLTLASNVVFMIAIVAVGLYIGSRRELLWTLRDRVERAEREQTLHVSQARTTERARIAREMHDVLAHRISLVAMHAGALTYRQDLTASEVRDSARVVEDAAHQALAELRDVLGVLRDDGAAAPPNRPQPTLADVEDLVDETALAGVNVTLRCEVDPAAVPVTTGRAVFRIVQEGLTNARKHARHARVCIAITGRPGDGVEVRVSNPLPLGAGPGPHAPRSGYGLVGLRERAELQGGRLLASADSETFVLEAWLPWPTGS